eukprot:6177994-Pleurochrysis_carterae.AAC.2
MNERLAIAWKKVVLAHNNRGQQLAPLMQRCRRNALLAQNLGPCGQGDPRNVPHSADPAICPQNDGMHRPVVLKLQQIAILELVGIPSKLVGTSSVCAQVQPRVPCCCKLAWLVKDHGNAPPLQLPLIARHLITTATPAILCCSFAPPFASAVDALTTRSTRRGARHRCRASAPRRAWQALWSATAAGLLLSYRQHAVDALSRTSPAPPRAASRSYQMTKYRMSIVCVGIVSSIS